MCLCILLRAAVPNSLRVDAGQWENTGLGGEDPVMLLVIWPTHICTNTVYAHTLMVSFATRSGLYCLQPPGRGLQMAGCLLLWPLLRGPHCACACVVTQFHLLMCVDANMEYVCLYVCRTICMCVCVGLWWARGNVNWGTSVTFHQRPHQSLFLDKGECAFVPPED